MLEHYVLFAAAEGRETDLETALTEFSDAIAGDCAALHEISWGRNINPSGLQRGFTHGCLARLADDGLSQYWDHQAHQRLLGQLDELCSERFAMDHYSGTTAGSATENLQPTTTRSTR
ncbi:Dabb family protein [Arthrobacter sp. I2-34]|uniref:Dabb family protein n=1 Tax=Arthrobacter hankyongi TaxID=2904801 RepID=A0ABS9L8X6_9MICC|nr:Dabb family protein [Arthrobacter hankyongi]MCG2622968.1 Dabb family protein [Arthrobacter hankyongi]